MILTDYIRFSKAIEVIKSSFRHKGIFFFHTLLISLLTTISYYNFVKENPSGSILRVFLGTARDDVNSRILIHKISSLVSTFFSINLYHVHFGFRVLTVILILYILRFFLKEVRTDSSLLPFLFPFATAFSFFNGYWYATDFLEILFFSLMLLLILKGKTLLFSLVFVVSFFNRESAMFILPFFLFNYVSRRKIREIVIFGSLIFLALVVIRLFILSLGYPVFSPDLYKLHSFMDKPANIFILKRFPSYPFWKLVSFSGFLYFFVFVNFRKIPPMLRHFLLIVGPVNLAGSLIVGSLRETRQLYPLIPCLILSSCIILKKRKGRTSLLPFLVIAVVSLFFVGNGLYLRKDSEFVIKSGAFNIEEFREVKRDFLVFGEKTLRFRDDKVIINLKRFPKKLFFLDSHINIIASENKPKECIVWLNNRIRLRKTFKKYGRDYYVRMRNLRFEMKNPEVQTAHITRLVIVYSGKTEKENIGMMEWKGFYAEND